MTKVVLADVTNILTNPVSAATTINNNSDILVAAIDNTLSRNGSTPNQMAADIDLNTNDLLNVGNITANRLDAQSIYINGSAVVAGGGGGSPSTTVTSVAGRTGAVVLTKTDVGLNNVDNTSDANKPVSTAQATADSLRLLASNNLSDVPNDSTARSNLGFTTVGSDLVTAATAFDARAVIGAAPLASPTFTGSPAAPTQGAADNSTLLATTAFVKTAIAALSSIYQSASAILTSLSAIGSSGILAINGITVSQKTLTAGAGIAVTNGDGVSGNPTFAVYGGFDTIVDGATVTLDFTNAVPEKNFLWTIGGNRTLGTPLNFPIGQEGYIVITQDATGSRTLSYSGDWKWPAGTPVALTTAANATDRLRYQVIGNNRIFLTIDKAFA